MRVFLSNHSGHSPPTFIILLQTHTPECLPVFERDHLVHDPPFVVNHISRFLTVFDLCVHQFGKLGDALVGGFEPFLTFFDHWYELLLFYFFEKASEFVIIFHLVSVENTTASF